jgi:predicted nucleic acid-binding protein
LRFALDSNVLVYGFIRDDPDKHETAARILIASDLTDAVVPAQVLGEFLNVVRRKHPEHFAAAVEQVESWQTTWTVLPTKADHVLEGAKLATRHRLQLWDAIIFETARDAKAFFLLTEDLHDALELEGVRVMNPFDAKNAAALDRLLAGAGQP